MDITDAKTAEVQLLRELTQCDLIRISFSPDWDEVYISVRSVFYGFRGCMSLTADLATDVFLGGDYLVHICA